MRSIIPNIDDLLLLIEIFGESVMPSMFNEVDEIKEPIASDTEKHEPEDTDDEPDIIDEDDDEFFAEDEDDEDDEDEEQLAPEDEEDKDQEEDED